MKSTCLVLLIGSELAGCAPGAADRGDLAAEAPQHLSGTLSETAFPVIRLGDLAERVSACRAVLRRFVPGEDLIEHLYFGWVLEPYRRATLAVALKTMAVLEREVKLRRRGADALADEQVASMLDWLDGVFAGDWLPVAPGFKPHRTSVRWDDWLDPAGAARTHPRALFAFADRATFTQADRWFGDFDLLAGCGFRVYPVGRNRPLGPRDVAALREHAQALRIGLVDAPLTSSPHSSLAGAYDLKARVRPVTLRDLLGWPDGGERVPAVIDPPHGEPWAGLLARRALYRGATGGDALAVGCVPPEGEPRRLRERMIAAMWVPALDGQRLGIVEGWRDIRDGTATPYGSRFASPAYLETVAHTALDLLRGTSVLEEFAAPRDLAILVTPEHLRAGDDNLWDEAFLEFVDGLLDRQIPFDLIPVADSGTSGFVQKRSRHYALTVELPGLGELSADEEVALRYRLRRGAPGERTVRASPRASPQVSAEQTLAKALADAVVGLLEEFAPPHRRFAVLEADGRLAPALFVRTARDAHGWALVNLTGESRSLRLAGEAGEPVEAELVDYLTGKVCEGGEIALAPYQVRILLP